jgi:ribosome-associated protein
MPEPIENTEEQDNATARRREEASDEGGTTATPEVFAAAELDERMLAALHAASEKKAVRLVALDLRPVASFTDYFLIAGGTNARQVQAIADGVVEDLKTLGTRPARVEGYNTGEWVLLDYGDFIFHVFEEKARRFYDLERLWREAARVPLPRELAGEEGTAEDGSLRTER